MPSSDKGVCEMTIESQMSEIMERTRATGHPLEALAGALAVALDRELFALDLVEFGHLRRDRRNLDEARAEVRHGHPRFAQRPAREARQG